MASTLTCLFSLYDAAAPEHLNYLHDPDLGGNMKKCVRVDAPGTRDATLFVRIPPPQRGHPKYTKHSTATITTMAAHQAEIRTQETVFVKWALDKQRVKALRHEAGFYANELRRLQGTHVPRLIGYYESTNKNEYFALSIFEHCFGGIPSDNAEYQCVSCRSTLETTLLTLDSCIVGNI